jgi:multiple antibiotic resistance protein
MTMGMLTDKTIVESGGPIALVIHHGLLLLAVVNPIGNIPIFADLTRELQQNERRHVMKLAVLTSLLLVIVFAVVGDWSLVHLFNVKLRELKIAGGLLLFILAVRGIIPSGEPYQQPADRTMLAVFPIAFPLLVGPGAITLTIITTQVIGRVLMIVTAAVTFALVFAIVRYADLLMRLTGPYAGMIVARLLYIFLAAKAVAMVLDGTDDFLAQLLPVLQATGGPPLSP